MARRRFIQVKGSPVLLTDDEAETASTGGSLRRGSRPMKEYYIYDTEFRELKRTGAIATILFALGSACMGFVVSAYVGLSLAEKIPDDVKTQWTVYKDLGFVATLIFYFLGVLESLVGYNQVERIKAETSHGTERYQAKSRYKVALWALVMLAFAVLGFFVRPMVWR
jgi:hypothetical protein